MKYIFYALMCCILFSACSKKVGVDEPNGVSVSLDPARLKADTFVYKVGDTTKFIINGIADNILLYSGELGHNYLYANRTTAQGIPQLAFTSNAQLGNQINTLQVLATDKLALLDSAHIVTANWTDITSKAVLSTGGGALASGTIDLSNIVNGPADSLFLAFKYTGVAGSIQRTWTITNLTVNNLLADGNLVSQLTLASDVAYWTKFKIGSSAVNWVPSSTQLQVVGGAATAPNNTSWIVSRPIYTGRVNPDVAVVIKQLASQTPMYTIAGKTYSGYNYQYTKAGVYTATVVIFNKSIDEQKTITKQFIIKVTL